MKLYANARLTLIRRREMVEMVVSGLCNVPEAATRAGVSPRTCAKWVARFEAEDAAGLLDGSSAPKRIANKTAEERIACIAALRRLRLTGPGVRGGPGMGPSTASGRPTPTRVGRPGGL